MVIFYKLKFQYIFCELALYKEILETYLDQELYIKNISERLLNTGII